MKMQNTFGLITAESRTDTTGGFLTMDGDLVDLSDMQLRLSLAMELRL